jgi:predicted alpha/beta-fold hydrolase
LTRAAATADYRAPAWLPGGNLQTIYANLLIRVPQVAYRRERLELADGDFLDFDWADGTPDTLSRTPIHCAPKCVGQRPPWWY